MRKLVSTTLLLALALGSCSQPETRPNSKVIVAPVSSKDLSALKDRQISRVPTLPTGGLVKGKTNAIPTEENIKRQTVNRDLPITWNDGFAGITMQTTREASKAILSDPQFSLDSGLDVYGEGLQITWGTDINPTPAVVKIYSDYTGALKLPAPYNDVKLGQDLTPLMTDDPDKETFVKTLGRAFAGKDATYDCLAAKECSVDYREGNLFYIDFPTGTMIMGENTIYVLDFSPNSDFVAKNKLPIVFNKSLAGIDANMSKAQAEAVLGAPYRYEDGTTQVYDAKTIRINYNAAGVIEDVAVMPGYQGTILISGKERGLGTSFADIAVTKDDADGLLMMKALGKILLGKEADAAYDCSAVMPEAECRSGHDKANGIIRILIGNMIFSFTDDETRTLMSVTMFNQAV